MAHGDAREGKWRRRWRMMWVASILHTTSEHGVSSITTADAHTSAASSKLNWRPCQFNWTRPFRRKTKSDLWTCAITFQTQSTTSNALVISCSGYTSKCRWIHCNALVWQNWLVCLTSSRNRESGRCNHEHHWISWNCFRLDWLCYNSHV